MKPSNSRIRSTGGSRAAATRKASGVMRGGGRAHDKSNRLHLGAHNVEAVQRRALYSERRSDRAVSNSAETVRRNNVENQLTIAARVISLLPPPTEDILCGTDLYGQRDMHEVLRNDFSLQNFRGKQAEVIERVVSRQSVLYVAPTAAGKSLVYQLPSLILNDLIVVISPLLSLLRDQLDSLRTRRIPSAVLASDSSPSDLTEIAAQLRYGALRVLMTTPEVFCSRSFADLMSRTRPPARVAVDEAHCVSEWGMSFRPAYLRIAAQIRRLGLDTTRDVIATTATATANGVREVCTLLGLGDEETCAILERAHRPEITATAIRCETPSSAVAPLLGPRGQLAAARKIVVYTPTRTTAENLASTLRSEGIAAEHYHAGASSGARAAAAARFRRGDLRVIVATIAFGLGVDIPDIDCVIHAGMPRGPDSYSQEVGRAGRGGGAARGVVLYCEDDYWRHVTHALFDGGDESVLREVFARVSQSIRPGQKTVTLDPSTLAANLPVSAATVGLAIEAAASRVEGVELLAADAPAWLDVMRRSATDVYGDDMVRLLADLLPPGALSGRVAAGDLVAAAAAVGDVEDGVNGIIEQIRRSGALENGSIHIQAPPSSRCAITLSFTSSEAFSAFVAAGPIFSKRRANLLRRLSIMWRLMEASARLGTDLSTSVDDLMAGKPPAAWLAAVRPPAPAPAPAALVSALCSELQASGHSAAAVPLLVAGIVSGYGPWEQVGQWAQGQAWGQAPRADPCTVMQLAEQEMAKYNDQSV